MTTNHIEKFWVSATSEHVTRVMNGVTVEARFRDGATERWIEGLHLGGWTKDNRYPWLDESRSGWNLCQVYAPPQWWLGKPDPGEDYRLLGKFPDEAVQGGDFIKNTSGGWTQLANGCNPTQAEGIWYRRRIEQPKPEPKYAVGQRVKIIGPVRGDGPIYNWTKEMDEYIGAVGTVRLKPTQDPEGTFYAVGEIVGWSFREDYLEAFVEPKHYVLQVGDTADTPRRHIKVTEDGIEVT